MTILLIDHSVARHHVLRRNLGGAHGYLAAYSLDAGSRMVADEHPDLVIVAEDTGRIAPAEMALGREHKRPTAAAHRTGGGLGATFARDC